MPPYVLPDKCDGCKNEADPWCVAVCPGNLFVIDPVTSKALCRDPGECWDCMTCTIFCPRQAIVTQVQYQLAPIPAELIPRLGKRHITWTLIDCKGRIYRLENTILAGGEED
ncbi:4Fe-4S dicluster domain-containing protein [Ammonifex thiophilus]|uniref:4Fe-4S ferredoxin n=1 Tax=Ammonifex thiophilus TaxID=444093 RepID=A0A3D8P6J5_9THEO|nr:4Fe-4S dicluster domain-containing protein [Ammonifex thiophilus]RDV83634.1 4Fe-4S ferredoxin [Ammonifex thiophilus]